VRERYQSPSSIPLCSVFIFIPLLPLVPWLDQTITTEQEKEEEQEERREESITGVKIHGIGVPVGCLERNIL
jgi:hypothetical protein